MKNKTVALCEPNTTNGVVINVSVKLPEWINDDPEHLIEYDEENPAGIGWQVLNGKVIVPPPPPKPTE